MPPATALPKGSEMRLMRPLLSAANFQEPRSTEEHADLHQEHVINKIQAVRNPTGQTPFHVVGGPVTRRIKTCNMYF